MISIHRGIGFHFPRNMLLGSCCFPKQERNCFNFFSLRTILRNLGHFPCDNCNYREI